MADLKFGFQLIFNFNGHSLWKEEFVITDSLNLFTDAAGSYGYGAYFNGH